MGQQDRGVEILRVNRARFPVAIQKLAFLEHALYQPGSWSRWIAVVSRTRKLASLSYPMMWFSRWYPSPFSLLEAAACVKVV